MGVRAASILNTDQGISAIRTSGYAGLQVDRHSAIGISVVSPVEPPSSIQGVVAPSATQEVISPVADQSIVEVRASNNPDIS